MVQNEVFQLSCNLDHFACQNKEQSDLLKSQLCEVQQNLQQLLQLPQKVERVEHKVETLEQKLEDLSCRLVRRQESVNPPSFFGALDRNEYFTGREKELESLDKAFEEVNTTGAGLRSGKRKAKVHGICGLGGCGKSSLAFEYAWRNLYRYPGGVFVINGESDDLLRASLQEIHREYVHKTQPNKHEEATQFSQLITETLSWLGNLREKWLLIVDNMDQKELSSCARKMFFGQWKNKTTGDILVTSRRSSEALCEDLDLPPENCLELNAFSLEESTEFLKKRTGLESCSDDQEQDVEQLAHELGGLPLALEQAAAYVKALKCSIQSYLEQYRSQKSTLLKRKSAKPCSEIYSEERLAVQTTWLLNFSYIENDEKDEGLGKASAFFMQIATYLFPDDIPIEILNVGAPEIENKYLKHRLKMPIGAKQIVDLLLRFSLFKRKSDDSLSIHRLVQETLKQYYDVEGQNDEVVSSAIRMLHHAFLNCVGGTDFLCDLHKRLDSRIANAPSGITHMHPAINLSLNEAKLEVRRWKMLSLNAFFLLNTLWRKVFLNPDYLRTEETARLSCEAAFFCYSLGMDSEGYRLQQLVLDILCAVKEPICFYKADELMKVTRILLPFLDPSLLAQKVKGPTENVTHETDCRGDNSQNNKLLEGIEVIEPKANAAFARGDFQTSFDLYSEIIKLSIGVNERRPRSLGKMFCNRGSANFKLGNIEAAVDDFNASVYVDNEYYRGYYWKAYALCKLVETGRTEFTSRAQAAAAVLHFKFAHSKPDDIRKLKCTFNTVAGLLDRIEYKFVNHVNQLKELESEFSGSQVSSVPFTVILAGGRYNFKDMAILGGRYYFVCPPGNFAMLTSSKGFSFSNGSFLFENVHFENPLHSVGDQLLSVKLGRSHEVNTEVNAGREPKLSAMVEAYDVNSLVVEHCFIDGSVSSGIMVKSHQLKQMIVSVRSCCITSCLGPGLEIQGGTTDSHISICNSRISRNIYGVFINSPARFYMEKNEICSSFLSGIVATGGCNGVLLKNSLIFNKRHGIFLRNANASIEENFIFRNLCWGILCCAGSKLTCKESVLQNNYCGGLRIMFNGKENVLVDKCEFQKNLGPDVFPAGANEIFPLEKKWKQLFKRTREFPIIFYLFNFLNLTKSDIAVFASEFNNPLLSDNRFLDVPDNLLKDSPPKVCSGCWKDLPSDVLDGGLNECPICYVSRYCSKQCLDAAKAVHSTVCNSILEANKKCEPLRPLFNSPGKESGQLKAGFSLCVITAVNVLTANASDNGRFKVLVRPCLLTCPERNFFVLQSTKIHDFVMVHGSHVQKGMMDIKATSILAKFDFKSETVTVHSHRIFSVDKVSGGWKWVEKGLDLFCERFLQYNQTPLFIEALKGPQCTVSVLSAS